MCSGKLSGRCLLHSLGRQAVALTVTVASSSGSHSHCVIVQWHSQSLCCCPVLLLLIVARYTIPNTPSAAAHAAVVAASSAAAGVVAGCGQVYHSKRRHSQGRAEAPSAGGRTAPPLTVPLPVLNSNTTVLFCWGSVRAGTRYCLHSTVGDNTVLLHTVLSPTRLLAPICQYCIISYRVLGLCFSVL